ncbi:histidine kinase [Nonomuraea muscovyensis]|uniref:sensor histidine kinase n=1 Tax=Nonomuraea muscovyensis TaxID=1124761 RepID=UPI00340D66CB
MRWRGMPLDVLLAVSGTGLDLLLSGKAGGGAHLPEFMTVPMALLVGAPLAFLRRWPLPVSLYLAVILVFADLVESFTCNTAQMLLCVAVGVVAHQYDRWAVVVALLAAVPATVVNLLDPGVLITVNTWTFSVVVPLLPVLVGVSLRGPAGRLDNDDLTPDLLLAGAGVASAVLGTWTDWDSGSMPVWVVGLFAVAGGLSLGVARRLPGMVIVLQGALLLAADTYLQEAVNTCLILTMIALAVFALRVSSWVWTVIAYLVGCLLAGAAVVVPGTDITPFRVVVLMALVITPIAIGRYLGVRQAAARAERLRARESARLAVAQVRADQLAERERIARDVHDIVAHHVGAMVLRAGAARYAAPEGPVADALGDIRDTGHQVLEDLRGLLDVLCAPEYAPPSADDPPDPHTGPPAPYRALDAEPAAHLGGGGLGAYLGPDGGPATHRPPGGSSVAVAAQDRLPVPGGAGFARRTGMLADPADVVRESAERVAAAGLVVDLVLDPAADRSPLVARASAARIIQEGLTNVLKHAGPGTEVRVALATTGRGLSIEIHNGRPPGHVERLPSSGRGLAGMRERIRALGGTLAAGPDGDGGWRLAAFLPTARSTTPGNAMALSAPRSHALDPGGGAEDGAGEWTEGGAGSRASAGARPGDAG